MADDKNDNMKIEKLNGSNYQSWKFNAKLVLMQKELWGIIDGSDEPPLDTETAGLKKKYRTRSDKAYSIIALSLETRLQVHIANTTDAKEAWTILERQFSFVSITQLVRLTRKFYAATMQEGDDMMEHITYMIQLAQELRDLQEDICPKRFATVILGSLPISYENFVTSLNARDANVLDWESIKGPLVEEYLKRKDRRSANNSSDDALLTRNGASKNAMPAMPRHSSNNNNNYNNFSNNNNYSNFRKTPNFPLRHQNKQNRGQGCYECGDNGHFARDCPMRNNMNNMSINNRGYNPGNNYNRPAYNRNREEGRFVNSCDNTIQNELALATGSDRNSNEEWFIDSAASKHMTSNRDIIYDFVPYQKPSEIYLGDDSIILAEGEGTVKLPIYEDDQKMTHLTLYKVLYVPNLAKNLVSVTAMAKTGAEVYFDNVGCTIHKDDKLFTIGHAHHGKLYRLNTNHEYASLANVAATPELWHQRLGHLNKGYMDQLCKGDLVTGMKCKNGDNISTCEPCILGKMQRASFPKQSTTKTSRVLELIHSDVCGPMAVDSKGGSRYFLTLTDDFSRYSVIYFLHKKSQVLSYFKEYVAQMENLTGQKLQRIRSDNGGEYTSNEFHAYCKQMGESHEFTNPHTPEQNGVSERLNRTIVDTARSMLIQSKLPLSFWAEAIQCAVYIRNRSPTIALHNKTPYECWFGEKPDLSNMRVFGCIAYAHVPAHCRTKLDPKSIKCVFTGYPNGTKGYRLYNLSTGKFIRSRSVVFCEDEFHDFNIKIDSKKWLYIFPHNNDSNNENDIQNNQIQEEPQPENGNGQLLHIPDDVNNEVPEIQSEEEGPHNDTENIENIPDNEVQDINQLNKTTYEESFVKGAQKLSKRVSKHPKRLIEEQCKLTQSLISDVDEPTSLQNALNDENWLNAMQSEMGSLAKNETWRLVPRPENKNVVGNRWVFKTKRNPDGTIYRHKARLVAQGYSQVHGLDYNEVFSPVAKFSTIRSLLALANIYNLEVHQMDVKTAFLNGKLDFEIYMEQPKGFVDPDHPDYVCLLSKSLYGLKQSARCWNETLTDYLISDGYKKCDADDCIYIKIDGNSFIILAIYVDDVIPTSNNTSMLIDEKLKLQQKFDMTDNGEISYILGMLIKRDREKRLLSISQGIYLENILKRFNMYDCNSCSTPLDVGRKFHKIDENDERCDITLYQQAIGCLTYAAITTRPDIAAAVGILSQYMSAPSSDHWSGVKRIFRYIKGTLNHGLLFSTDNENKLSGYSDADWAGDADTRRSTSGYTFYIGQALISWSSRKQATVAKSSTEAEYVALSCSSQEAIWLRRLFSNIQYQMNSATIINEDNQGAIELSKNPKHHNRTKHIDTSFHFIRERVLTKEIEICYCPSNEMVADIMTKALPRVTFEKFRDMLGIYKV